MSSLPVAVHTAAQVRALDRHAIDDLQIPSYTLMTRAGEAALGALRSCWPSAQRIAVVCGPGNNGGDGYVLARLARAQRLEVVADRPARVRHDCRATRAARTTISSRRAATVVGWHADCLRGRRRHRRCDLRRRPVARRSQASRRKPSQRSTRATRTCSRSTSRAACTPTPARCSASRCAPSARSRSSGSSSASISAKGRTASASSCSIGSSCRRRRWRTSTPRRRSSTRPPWPSCCRRVDAPRTRVSRAACS